MVTRKLSKERNKYLAVDACQMLRCDFPDARQLNKQQVRCIAAHAGSVAMEAPQKLLRVFAVNQQVATPLRTSNRTRSVRP